MFRVHTRETAIMDEDTQKRIANTLLLIAILILGIIWLRHPSSSSTSLQTDSSVPDSSQSYEHVEVWNFRGDDTVRFAVLDTYSDALKRTKWLSIPLVWNDTDIADSTPLNSILIESHVEDYTYGGQIYRSHSYIVESDQRQFGYSATFKVLPHVHVTGAASRLLSIGFDPSSDFQTKFVVAVILPDGARDITVTDMQPYKTLMYNNTRALYYYDVHSIASHQSIHIAYTLTGIPTTEIDLSTVINDSNP